MVILVRYAEIGIKGKNRDRFERLLMNNIDACLRANNISANIRKVYGRILVDSDSPCSCLKRVFGIASFSQTVNAGKTIDEMTQAASKLVTNLTENDSFRITCQRLDKVFPLTSKDVCIQLGDKLRQLTKAKVKMREPTVEVMLEIIDGVVYLLSNRVEGPGGMPLNSQDKVIALIEDENSVLAALLVMKRGCTVIPVLLKALDLSLLKDFSCGIKLEPEKIPNLDELSSLMAKHNVQAIVVNDTVEGARQLNLNALVLRPLAGLGIEEIKHERESFEHLRAY